MCEIIILFEVYPQLFHKEVLAKPRAWEGQRPRCPRFAAVRATRTLPLHVAKFLRKAPCQWLAKFMCEALKANFRKPLSHDYVSRF